MAKSHTRRIPAFIGVILAAALVAACTTPPSPNPTPNAAGLHAALASGGIQVTWNPTGPGQTNGYDLQYRVDGAGWVPIETSFDNTVLFDDVTEFTQYWFRVRAKAAPGASAGSFSDSVTAWYVVPKLPIIRIDTQDRAPILDRENYVRASMTLDPNGSGYAPYSGTLEIRGRGNSTWQFPKKPYRLKLDTKSPLMGIASNRHWVLLANWFDKSQIRTATAEAISKSTDLAWTPTYRHVEVVLNGQYVGVYQLTEQVRSGSNRVDIPELDENDVGLPTISGGYLLEIDSRLEENDEPGFRTSRNNVPVVVKEPDPATSEQFDYIRGAVNGLESSLYSPTFTDPVSGYRSVLDVDAYIDHYLLQEITRNGDAFWSSTFFYKDRDDNRFHFGPMWDFDRSQGSTVTPKPQPPEDWYARDFSWTRRMLQDPAFAAQLDARFRELLPTLSAIPEQMSAVSTSLLPAIDNDEARWGYTTGPSDEPAYLEQWLEARLAWMEQNSSPLPTP